MARADRQRPDRRLADPWAALGSRPARRGDWSTIERTGRRRPSAATYATRRRASVIATSRRSRPLAGRRHPGRRGGRASPTSSPTCRGSARSSRRSPGSSSSTWFGRGPARDLPRPQARRARRPLAVDRSASSTCPTSGRRRTAATPTSAGWSSPTRPGRRPAAHARPAAPGLGDPLPGRRPRRGHPRRRSSCRAPETVVHLDAAHRGLGTASCGPDTLPEYLVGPGHLPLVLDARADRARLTMPIDWVDEARQLHLRNDAHQLPPRGCSRTARSACSISGRALATGRSYRHLGAGPVRRLLEPPRRPGRARVPDPRQRRLPGPGARRRAAGRLDRPGARLPRPPDRGRQAADRRPAGDLRRGGRRGRHPRGRRWSTAERPRGRASLHDLPRRAGRRPERPDPQRRRRGGPRSTLRDERRLDLPDADWRLVQLERRLGPRAARRRAPPRAGPPVGRRACAARRAIEHNPFIALRRADDDRGRTARRIGFSLVYSGNFLAEVEVDPFGTTRRPDRASTPDGFAWRSSRARSSRRRRRSWPTSADGLGELSDAFHRLYRERLARGHVARPAAAGPGQQLGGHLLRLRRGPSSSTIAAVARATSASSCSCSTTAGSAAATTTRPRSATGSSTGASCRTASTAWPGGSTALGLDFGLWIEPEMVSAAEPAVRGRIRTGRSASPAGRGPRAASSSSWTCPDPRSSTTSSGSCPTSSAAPRSPTSSGT